MWNAGRINRAGCDLSRQLDSGVLFFSFNPKPFSFKDRILESCQCYCSRSIVLDVSVLTEWIDGSGRGRPLGWATVFSSELCHQCPGLFWHSCHSGQCPATVTSSLFICVIVLICFSAWGPETKTESLSPPSLSLLYPFFLVCLYVAFFPNADHCPALCYIDLSCWLMGDHLSCVLSLSLL